MIPYLVHLGIIPLSLLIFSGSCAYRFTNRDIKIPGGIKTIAFESIYDTSREVFPHEVLWESLQKAFAADGHLRLVSQGRADALLRAHITSGSVKPTGSAEQVDDEKKVNAKKYDDEPEKFKILPQAGEYTHKDAVEFAVVVEVIDLYSKETIFRQQYAGSDTFASARSESLTQRKTHFLQYDEAFMEKFRRISDRIAENVRRDFIVGR